MHTSRFAYHGLIKSSPWPTMFKILGVFMFGTSKTTPTSSRVNTFEKYLLDSDPIGDAVAADIAQLGSASKSIFSTLRKAIATGHCDESYPESLHQLISTAYTDPEWLDRSKVESGAAVCRRLGQHAMAVLGDLALLGGYANADISKPLTFTGALRGDSTFDRLSETSQFWVDVTRKGGLQKGAKGFCSAIHVRIMHSIVRRKLLHHSQWDSEKWGTPINMADSLATNIGFSMGMIYGCKRLGFLLTQRDIEAVLHLWKYIGYLMGDDVTWLPNNTSEGLQCLQIVHLSNRNEPDGDSKALARDYLESFKPRELKRDVNYYSTYINYMRNEGYAQWLIPPDLYLKLDLPHYNPISLLFPIAEMPVNFIKDSSRLFSHQIANWLDKEGAKAQEDIITQRMGNRSATFIPSQ